jgi:hypothetical protein
MTRLFATFALLLAPTLAHSEPLLPAFDPAAFAPGQPIDNPYLPLAEGFYREFTAAAPALERIVLQYGGPGPVLGGVETTILLDQAFEDGLLVEETRDFYAQDRDGNVWYMGEDVTNITYDDEDRVTGTDSRSSWRTGVNDALPGYQMPAKPAPGIAFIQEHAPADAAMDAGEIIAVGGTLTGPTGDYTNVVAIYETSPVEPALQEIKYYAPGTGMIRAEEAVDAQKANPELTFDLIRTAP